jgi:hypothetical protein
MVTRTRSSVHPQMPERPQPGRSFRPGEQIFELNDDTANRKFVAERQAQERAASELAKRILQSATGAVPRSIGRSA